jgi:hypothetical protein
MSDGPDVCTESLEPDDGFLEARISALCKTARCAALEMARSDRPAP